MEQRRVEVPMSSRVSWELEDCPRTLGQGVVGDPRSGGGRVEGNYLPGPQDGPHFCNSAVTQPRVLARVRVREGDAVGAGKRGTEMQERDKGQRTAGQSPKEAGTKKKGDRFRKGSKRHKWEGVETQERKRERGQKEKRQ